MIQFAKIEALVSKLRTSGSDDDAKTVENLLIEFRHLRTKYDTARNSSDFYARLVDMKLNWSE
jgi:hypothetical protein